MYGEKCFCKKVEMFSEYCDDSFWKKRGKDFGKKSGILGLFGWEIFLITIDFAFGMI